MAELSLSTTGPFFWRAFSGDTTEAEARAIFQVRYGSEPETVGLSFGNVLAGPVPGAQGGTR